MSIKHLVGQGKEEGVQEHKAMVENLALFLGTPYTETTVGHSGRIADVIDVNWIANEFQITIYEVKVTRPDFINEIMRSKWKDSIPYCHRFYFATRSNVASKSEIPPECGWVVFENNQWVLKKNCKIRQVETFISFLKSLIFKRKSDFKSEKKLTKNPEW